MSATGPDVTSPPRIEHDVPIVVEDGAGIIPGTPVDLSEAA
jgi:hypothetical protein